MIPITSSQYSNVDKQYKRGTKDTRETVKLINLKQTDNAMAKKEKDKKTNRQTNDVLKKIIFYGYFRPGIVLTLMINKLISLNIFYFLKYAKGTRPYRPDVAAYLYIPYSDRYALLCRRRFDSPVTMLEHTFYCSGVASLLSTGRIYKASLNQLS